jgi:hypothetical protein
VIAEARPCPRLSERAALEGSMEKSAESFRMSFWWLFAYVMGVSATIAVPLAMAIILLNGARPSASLMVTALAVALAAGEAFACLSLLLFIAYFKVHVSQGGLGAFNTLGLYREIAWADVASTKRVNLLGMQYIRLYSSRLRLPVSIPLFLSDLDRFYQVVCRHAGPDHPLALALHEKLTVER